MGRSESARDIRGSLTKRLFVQSLAERKDSGRNSTQCCSQAQRRRWGVVRRTATVERRCKLTEGG